MMLYGGGDSSAFETLYARHKGAVYRFFLRQLDPDAAAECHQEVWLKLISFRSDYKPVSGFKSFLFTIAHNTLTDHYRRNRRHQMTRSRIDPDELPAENEDGSGFSDALDRENLVQRLRSGIHRLPFAQREALVLKQETGMPIKTIAEVTGSTEEGIKSRLRYAINRLKRELVRREPAA